MTSEESLRVAKLADKLVKSGICTITGEEAVTMIRDAASRLNIDLEQADLERTREILSRGKPMSQIIREMRYGEDLP